MKAGLSLLLGMCAAITGCAPGLGGRSEAGIATSGLDDTRTLIIALRTEPAMLVSEELQASHTGNSPDAPWQLFNAELTQMDEKGTPHLQLAETFPQLNTDTWKVLADGRMETTWTLRPNLTWHDGTPLVADDFVLSAQFQRLVGKASPSRGTNEVEGASAPDARTLVIRYKTPFPDAGSIAWEPLPRHILSASIQQSDSPESLYDLPYWTTEFVGVGPYQLERWETGAYISGTAFPGFALGKPRIGRLQVVWIGDPNTTVANLLADTVHLATDLSLTFDQVSALKHEWAGVAARGKVLLGTARTVYVQLQFRPEVVQPKAMLDVRFRQALAHGIDKQAIVDAVLDGEPGMADAMVAKEEEFYPELLQVLTKYPLDLRRSDQLLSSMGFAKDGEGYYGQGGSRLNVSLTPFGNYLREALVLADGWKKAGIDTPVRTLSAAEQLNRENSQNYPALGIIQFGIKPNPLPYFVSSSVVTTGPNMGGYADPEIDRLYHVYAASLDRNDRNQAVIQGMKLLSEQAAYFPLYYGYEVVAHTGHLVGPRVARQKYAMWTIEQWHWE